MGKINILNDAGTNKLTLEFNGTSDGTLDVAQIPQKNQLNTFTTPISVYQGTQGQKRSINVLVTGGINDGYYDGISFWQAAIGTGAHLGQIRVPYTNSGIGEFEWWGRPQLESGSGSPYLKIDKYGRITNPFQPAFMAISNAGGNTGGSGNIVFGNVTLNVGNCYNASTGYFTAPISGTYQFSAHTLSRSGGYSYTHFRKNNANYVLCEDTGGTSSYRETSGTMIIQLAANDTVNIYSPNSTYGSIYDWFCGHLIG